MRLGIIGAGRIGEAMISGLLKAGFIKPSDVIASDINEERLKRLSSAYGIECVKDNAEVVRRCEVVVLSVKPKDVRKVLEEIREGLTADHLLISVAAGIATSYIARILDKQVPIVRAMPNVAVFVREGMTAITPGPWAEERHVKLAEELFASVGKVVRVPEDFFDAITALSGSGPAYASLIIEAMTDAGIRVGLPRETAAVLAAQSVLGAAKMLLETGEHPAKLREMVTTPAGVTIEGIVELEEGKLRATIIRAITRATQRSKELLNQ
ncbi:MAG: pyrroline-5-carboxylate reductase [Candidatus Nezhaarchaeales archaeon]